MWESFPRICFVKRFSNQISRLCRPSIIGRRITSDADFNNSLSKQSQVHGLMSPFCCLHKLPRGKVVRFFVFHASILPQKGRIYFLLSYRNNWKSFDKCRSNTCIYTNTHKLRARGIIYITNFEVQYFVHDTYEAVSNAVNLIIYIYGSITEFCFSFSPSSVSCT